MGGTGSPATERPLRFWGVVCCWEAQDFVTDWRIYFIYRCHCFPVTVVRVTNTIASESINGVHYGPWEEDGQRRFTLSTHNIVCRGEVTTVIVGGWQDRAGNETRDVVIQGGCLEGPAIAELISILTPLAT